MHWHRCDVEWTSVTESSIKWRVRAQAGRKHKCGSSQTSMSELRQHFLCTHRWMCEVSPHCGFRSYLSVPVGTLRPGSGPCSAVGAEPRCPLRADTRAWSRNDTRKHGLTLEQCCSRLLVQARRMKPAGTMQWPGLEEPNRPSWEPCRGHQKRGEGISSPAAGAVVARCFCVVYKVHR